MRRDLRTALPTYPRCRGCQKVTAPTLADAKRIVREIRARTGESNALRYYRCPHGGWHWTQMLEQPTHLKEEHLA